MPSGASPRLSWIVASCVLFSGMASLALEVCWSRVLKLVFGSTTLAITTILVAYMLGLGVGGLLGGRLAARFRNGVRAYGWMELAVGVYALTVPWLLSFYPELNRSLLAPLGFWPAAIARFSLVLVVLLVPTILMGATLPILVAALVRREDELARRVGLLYGMNTLGAVAGVILATFVSFRAFGLATTNTIAAALDIVVGALAVFVVAPRLGRDAGPAVADGPEAPEVSGATATAKSVRRWSPVVVTYGFVGFTALANEVAWTRALTMVLGGSVYAFATMLAGFLAGIALGSLVARRWLDRLRSPEAWYAAGLALLGLSSLVVVFAFRALPGVFLGAFASVGVSGANLVWLGLLVSFLVMLAPTFILGALFPLVVRLAGRRRGNARAVGDVYFANTLGSAAGAFAAGFVLIPVLGLRWTMALAIAVNFAAAAVVFLSTAEPMRRRRTYGVAAAVGAVLVLVFPPAWDPNDFATGVYYRSTVQLDFGLPKVTIPAVGEDELLFYEEGVNCTVSVHRNAAGLEEGLISLRINGKTDASIADMSTQVLSGHLPLLFGGAETQTALVIGYASGITAGALSLYDLRAIDVCEIEPAVIEASRWFEDYNHRPLERDNVRLIVDDGRSVLSTARDEYDVIISEPSNPWMTGCANLFTAEFFREARASLKPNGSLLQWIQLYGMDEAGMTSVLAALFESFDHAYGFLYQSNTTDLLLIATDEPLTPDSLPRWSELSPLVRRDLARLRLYSTADLWSLLVLAPDDLRELARRAPVTNTDDSMFVELRAPWYLYDDTPETQDSIRAVSSGILPIFDGATFEWPDGLRGELALAYLGRRLDQRLGDTVYATLDPVDEEAYRAVYDGELEILLGRASEPRAMQLFDRAVALEPDAFLPRWHRGWLLNRLDRIEESEHDLTLAHTMQPGHLELRHERFRVLGSLNRMREARAEVEILLNSPLVETAPRLWAEGSYLAGGFGEYEVAIERAKRFLELMPNSPEEWSMLAEFYQATGREAERAEALESVDYAIRNLVREFHWLARWQERYGTREEAMTALEEALAMDPEYAAAREDLERLRAGG